MRNESVEVRGQWSEVGRAREWSPFVKEKLFVPERGSVLHALSKDGSMILDKGRGTVLYCGQRVFALKRTAALSKDGSTISKGRFFTLGLAT
ncbi:hypothetical protein [Mesotoga sp. H07.pep.5.3]|uniref:hypothetical protein n=1 Tax=Mesotoga sp. H07.pep.5.3 TaxID=1421003 RepID=UPI000C183953|nr:hypothetical protein [Mesotoga sp. H07.pep.5.3]PIJ61100.1 hypothetical protein V513_11150 [Mesotoga sp. H07.pep.5.3]